MLKYPKLLITYKRVTHLYNYYLVTILYLQNAYLFYLLVFLTLNIIDYLHDMVLSYNMDALSSKQN